MSIANNIIRLRKIYGLSQKELGTIAGVSDKAVSTWETGTKEPRMGVIQKIADHFGLKKSNIIEENGLDEFFPSTLKNIKPIITTAVPIIGKIAAGKPILAEENIDGYAKMADGIHADFCLQVQGDSMINARIMDGDIVFIRQQPEVENGEIAAVLIDGAATLKRFYHNDSSVTLMPENPKYPPYVYTEKNCSEFKILGKAIAFQSLVK